MTEYVNVGGNEPKRPFQTPNIAQRAKQTAKHIKHTVKIVEERYTPSRTVVDIVPECLQQYES